MKKKTALKLYGPEPELKFPFPLMMIWYLCILFAASVHSAPIRSRDDSWDKACRVSNAQFLEGENVKVLRPHELVDVSTLPDSFFWGHNYQGKH